MRSVRLSSGEVVPVPQIIAIDGTAASGKSTLGKNLAEWLGFLYFDTGVMYRALTWLVLQNRYSVEDEQAVTSLAEQALIDVRPPSKTDGRAYDVWIEGTDVTWEIRAPNVDANVSIISAYPGVRKALTSQQRRIGLRGRVVMVGRDIGTVVLPEANLKVFLDAKVEERARRRFEEMRARGENASLPAIKASMLERDRIDSTRTVAPLRPAQNAVIIHTEDLDAVQVLERIKHLVLQHASQE